MPRIRSTWRRSADDHSITFPKVWNDIKPYWLGDDRMRPYKKDPMAQYTPSNPTPKSLITATSGGALLPSTFPLSLFERSTDICHAIFR